MKREGTPFRPQQSQHSRRGLPSEMWQRWGIAQTGLTKHELLLQLSRALLQVMLLQQGTSGSLGRCCLLFHLRLQHQRQP